MIRIGEIQERLLHVVGWEKPFNPADTFDSSLTMSESGLYFQQAHPLLTIDNMKAIMPDNYGYEYPSWDSSTGYLVGDKVRHNNVLYICTKNNIGQEPTATDFNNDYSITDFGNPYWLPYNVLGDFLRKTTKAGISKAVQTFLRMKQLNKETKNLLEHRTLFDGAGRINDTITNNSRLVGLEIVPIRSSGVTTKIERIGLQFTGQGDVKIYLFHSSRVEPIATTTLFYYKNGGMQWFDLNGFVLPYMSQKNDAGGSWYICYNQDDLPTGMEAINKSKDWSREPCGTCNAGSLQTWREITKYLQVSPFCVPALSTFEEYPEMWDIADNIYTNTRNYGINLDITVGCDLTEFIIEQRHLFQDVIQLEVAATALRTLALNPNVRVNRNQSNASKAELLYELDGNPQGRESGLGLQLKQAYEAIRIDTQGLDRICLACNNHGVRYKTV